MALVASAAAPAQAPAPRVHGRVLDEHGRPIAGAAVALCGPRWTTADVLARPDARTDAEGHFAIPSARIAGIPDCRGLAIAAPERATAKIRHRRVFGVPRMFATLDHDVRDVLLPPAVTLRGRVRTLASQPLPGAVVSAESALQRMVPDQDYWPRIYVTTATCDAKGGFELTGAIRTGAVVRAIAQGYYRETRPFVTATDPLVFELRPSGEVVGRLVDDAGAPVAGLVHLKHGDDMSLEHYVGADGRFRIGIELPGPFVVHGQPLDPLGWAPGSSEAAAPNAEVAVRLPRHAETRVRVREKATGAPIAGASVRLAWVDESSAADLGMGWAEHESPVTTDDEGMATIRGRSPGWPVVGQAIVSQPGFARLVQRAVRVPDHGPIEFELQAGKRVSGIVRDADTEQPIAGAEIAWTFETAADMETLPSPALTRHTVTTDATGKFTVPDLSADDVTSIDLQARAAGFAPAQPRTIAIDGNVEFELSRGFTLQGKVRGVPDGMLASVFASSATGRPQFTSMVPLAPDSSFALRDVRGRYDVNLCVPAFGHPTGRLNLRLGNVRVTEDTEREFKLEDQPLSQLRGRVRVRGADLPVHRLAVLADLDPSAGPLRSMLDAEGRFHLPAVQGSYLLRIVDVATGATLAWRLVQHDADAAAHEFDLHLTELRVAVRGGLEARLRTSVGICVAPPAELPPNRSSLWHRPLVSPLSLTEGQTSFVAYLPAQPVIAKLYSYTWHDDHFMVAEAELTPALGRVNTLELNLPDK